MMDELTKTIATRGDLAHLALFLGALASDELAAAIAKDFDIALTPRGVAAPLLHGMALNGMASAREALEVLTGATGLELRDGPAGIELIGRTRGEQMLAIDRLARSDGPLTSVRRGDPTELVSRVALSFADRSRDYLSGMTSAVTPREGASASRALPLVLDGDGARRVSELLLRRLATQPAVLELTLPPSFGALEPGDRLCLEGAAGSWRITELRDGLARRVVAQEEVSPLSVLVSVDGKVSALLGPPAGAAPAVVTAHLPAMGAGPSRLAVGARARPWPEWVELVLDATGASLGRIGQGAGLGHLLSPLPSGPSWVWDESAAMELLLFDAHLVSRPEPEVLAGANQLAVQTASGWEIIGFAEAELIAPRTYRLRRLLRGQRGTTHAIAAAPVGARVLLLDERVVEQDVPHDWLGETLALTAYAGAADATGEPVTAVLEMSAALPLSPVHLRAEREAETGDVLLRWVRRSRADSDAWSTADAPLDHAPEAYRVTIGDGIGDPLRELATPLSSYRYAAADQVADFGVLPDIFDFSVAQLSAVLGAGHASLGTFNG